MITPKRYRKKPVEIEAVKITESNIAAVAVWCKGFQVVARDLSSTPVALTIPTLEGNMRAEMGDYIIRGVEGEFYACKRRIFEKTYEEVEK